MMPMINNNATLAPTAPPMIAAFDDGDVASILFVIIADGEPLDDILIELEFGMLLVLMLMLVIDGIILDVDVVETDEAVVIKQALVTQRHEFCWS